MKLKNILAVLLVMALASCMKYEDIQFVGIENMRVAKVGMNDTRMEMDLIFYNPNNMGAALNNATGKVWVENIYLGNFLLNNNVAIPAKSNFSVPAQLSVDVKSIVQNSLTLLFKDSVELRVDGNAALSKTGITRNVPLQYTGKKSAAALLQELKLR